MSSGRGSGTGKGSATDGGTGAGTRTGAGTAAEHAERAARRFEKARRMTERSFEISVGVFGVMGAASMVDAFLEDHLAAPLIALVLVAGTAFLVLYIRLVRAGLQGRVPVGEIVASGLLAAALSTVMLVSPAWFIVGTLWVSAVAICLPFVRQIVALSAGAAVVPATMATVEAGEKAHWYMWPAMFALFAALAAGFAALNLLQKWVWDLFQEAYTAREAQAVLAVTEERLRFARDLHDLLGHNLSLIAVKSELAIRMTGSDPARATAEMVDVRQAARDALREVRAAVHGYRVVDLDAELASVRTVLEAAGVRCTVDETPSDLPPDVRRVLAWVVREGATNVLKHSGARRCEISLAVFERSMTLEMVNDGAGAGAGPGPAADPDPDPDPDPGSDSGSAAATGTGTGTGAGLTGLTERVATVGGDLTAEHAGHGRFLLRVTVPLPSAAEPAAEPLRSIA